MLESDLIKWLSNELKGTAEVYHNKPDKFYPSNIDVRRTETPKFVTLERIAGRVENYTDRADILIHAWCGSSYEASKLAYKIRNILLFSERPSSIYNIQVDNLYENRDPDGYYGRYAISAYVIATLGDE